MSEQNSVVLFGLTGTGKSTISNMLIQGDIHDEKNAFKVNDAAVGVSFNINCSSNEKFIVYDTIGVGEPFDGTVPHQKAVNELRNYFSTCQVPLNYIAYVKKKGRITDDDHKQFKILKEIFEGGETNFIIIITECGQKWVDKNLKDLKKFGDYPIIPVDFPWSEDDDESDAVNNGYKRSLSLQHLIVELSNLSYKGIILQVLSSNQQFENKVAEVIDFIPVVGSTYQLISAGVYYKMGKSNLAEKRLKNGAFGLVLDATSVGVLREGAILSKAAYNGFKEIYNNYKKSDK
ncbi:11741_t:CDS:1 [Funneliformis geosporum]|nr:11741_t:CDS:1 [Funneliformis geosporum]